MSPGRHATRHRPRAIAPACVFVNALSDNHRGRDHTRDFDYKGHTHRASQQTPQYEIKSDKTDDHIAAHKGRVLSKIE